MGGKMIAGLLGAEYQYRVSASSYNTEKFYYSWSYYLRPVGCRQLFVTMSV